MPENNDSTFALPLGPGAPKAPPMCSMTFGGAMEAVGAVAVNMATSSAFALPL